MYQIYSLRTPSGKIVYAGRKKVEKIKSDNIIPTGLLMKQEINFCCKLTVHKECLIADTHEATAYVRKLMVSGAPITAPIIRQSIREAIVDELVQDKHNYFADFVFNPHTGLFDVVEVPTPAQEPELSK